MSISYLTALTIQTNKVVADAGLNGKYFGIIRYADDSERHPGMVLISTTPSFDTFDEAKSVAQEVLRRIMGEDLSVKFN